MRRLALALLLAAAAAAAASASGADEGHALVVGDTAISAAEYESALRDALRRKFYHRRVPDAELAQFQRDVAARLIDQALVASEAQRRGMSVQALEAALRAVEAPAEAELRAYYERHGSLFVQPERVRLSIILFKVDPSSPGSEWERATDQARATRAALQAGERFSGSDMGYLHRGMIPEPLYAQLEGLQAGEISPPIRLLEGVALLRLEERIAARVQAFDEARARAVDLWRREQGETRWRALIASLRSSAPIRVDGTRYPALVGLAP